MSSVPGFVAAGRAGCRSSPVRASLSRPYAAVRVGDGTVDVTWTPVAGDVEYRVRRLDGARWQVVGRTRGTRLQDGGAPAGITPVYAVSAAQGGVRSAEGRSDGT